MNTRYILASASPRRKQLMAQIGIACEIIESNVDETAIGAAKSQVEELALRKACAVCGKVAGEAVVIAADTLVALDDEVLGKPTDRAEAFAMLSALAGRRHTVYTGVAVVKLDAAGAAVRTISFVEATDVFFRPLTDDEINAYIDTGEPFDKAGAYGAQERGGTLVSRIEGDYFAVVGLPLARLVVALRDVEQL